MRELNHQDTMHALRICADGLCNENCPLYEVEECEEALAFNALAAIDQKCREIGRLEARLTPKEVEVYYRTRGDLDIYRCPVCDGEVSYKHHELPISDSEMPEYCMHCGQALSWRGVRA